MDPAAQPPAGPPFVPPDVSGDRRLPLSIAIVCKNSEATIGRTLASVAPLAREIVALDSGSTDRTIEMLEAAGARVERVAWQGYVRTKQLAAEACTQDWIMILDSDESIEPDLAASLSAALAEGGAKGYAVNRKVHYAGRFLDHAWQPEWRLRIVPRALIVSSEAYVTGIDPHDELVVRPREPGTPRIVRLRGTLRHDTIADMPRFLAGQLRHASLGAEQRHKAGRRATPLTLLTNPTGAFLKQLILRSAWRDGWRGWAAAGATACHALMKHLVLLERCNRTDPADPTPP